MSGAVTREFRYGRDSDTNSIVFATMQAPMTPRTADRESTVIGDVILLNGTPSSGKSTIARALWEVLEPPHWYRSLDDFIPGYLPRHWDAARGPWWKPKDRPLFSLLVEGYLRALRAMALVGHRIISESVILPVSLDTYLDAFDGVPLFLVGVRCPLEVAQQRERQRSDRLSPGGVDLAVPEFELVHSHGPYDIEVDTSVTSVADAVAGIRSAWASRSAPGAFDRLRARRRLERID